MDIKKMIEEVGDIKIKDESFLGYNKNFLSCLNMH